MKFRAERGAARRRVSRRGWSGSSLGAVFAEAVAARVEVVSETWPEGVMVMSSVLLDVVSVLV